MHQEVFVYLREAGDSDSAGHFYLVNMDGKAKGYTKPLGFSCSKPKSLYNHDYIQVDTEIIIVKSGKLLYNILLNGNIATTSRRDISSQAEESKIIAFNTKVMSTIMYPCHRYQPSQCKIHFTIVFSYKNIFKLR